MGDSRIIYLTGKGGVGKSSVASALAAEAASRGLAAALVSLDGSAERGNGNAPDSIAKGVQRFALDLDAALRGLLVRTLRSRFLSARLMDSRTFSAVAAAAPGLKDLVYMSRIGEIADGRDGRRFDVVVVDGMASGHTTALLAAPRRVRELVPVGPAATIAREADAVVRDGSRFKTVVVTLAEELPVTEALALYEDLADIDIVPAFAIANAVYPELCGQEQIEWLQRHPESSRDAGLYIARRARQLELVERLRRRAGRVLVLPHRFAESHAPDDAVRACVDALLGESVAGTGPRP